MRSKLSNSQAQCAMVSRVVFYNVCIRSRIHESKSKKKGLSRVMRANTDERQDKFRKALLSGNFTVSDGSAHTVDSIVNFDNKIMDSAAGNNAGQPYKAVRLPSAAASEETANLFKLESCEAVVYVGLTPPKADYFSFAPYMNERMVNPIVAKGDWVFAALGDPINNMGINTEAAKDAPFAAQTVIIFAADEDVFDRVKHSAIDAGYPAGMINQYIIPSKLLNMGTADQSDSLMILVRGANFANEAEREAYLNDDNYATIWHVQPKEMPVPNLFTTPSPKKRVWKNEEALVPGLAAGLERLKAAILANTGYITYKSFESARWFAESRDVLESESNRDSPLYHKYVAGEGSDTTYLRTTENGEAANFVLGESNMVIVYGVNHAATGLSTYSNFSIYGDWITSNDPSKYRMGCGDSIWNGVAGMTSHDFAGSAAQYIPNDPMAKYLYAVKVVRKNQADGNDKYTIVVPTPEGQATPSYGIALDKPVMIGYRSYLNPHTKIGPDYGDIIHERALWFAL